MSDSEYDKKVQEANDALRPELTPQFLQLLVKALRTVGWGVDYTESRWFVEACFEIAGKEMPDDVNPFVSL